MKNKAVPAYTRSIVGSLCINIIRQDVRAITALLFLAMFGMQLRAQTIPMTQPQYIQQLQQQGLQQSSGQSSPYPSTTSQGGYPAGIYPQQQQQAGSVPITQPQQQQQPGLPTRQPTSQRTATPNITQPIPQGNVGMTSGQTPMPNGASVNATIGTSGDVQQMIMQRKMMEEAMRSRMNNTKGIGEEPTNAPSKLGQMDITERLNDSTRLDASERAKIQVNKEMSTKIAKAIENGSTLEEALSDAIADRDNSLGAVQIYGQQIFRNRELALFRRDDVKAPENYVLSGGDVVSVSVWGAQEFSGVLALSEEGYVKFDRMPRLYLKGLTFAQAKDKIRSQFKEFFNLQRSQIDIALNYERAIKVNITGEVQKPGQYTISALNNAVNALVAADGPTNAGSVRRIKVATPNRPDKTLDLYEFLQRPNAAADYVIDNGSYIFIPAAGKTVTIQGSVVRSFKYELLPNEQLNSALGYAGGFRPEAYKANIQITRYAKDEVKIIDVDYNDLQSRKEDFELVNGDIITIGSIPDDYFTNYAYVRGEVKMPGRYEIKEGETRVSDFLNKAGLRNDAVTNIIYLSRLRADLAREYFRLNADAILLNANSPDNMLLKFQDELIIYSKTIFRHDYTVKIEGEVNRAGEYPLRFNTTLKDILFQAGGLKKEADNTRVQIARISFDEQDLRKDTIITLSVSDSLFQQQGTAEIRLQPYDQIFVRRVPGYETKRNMTFEGEVRYPGEYPILTKGERVSTLFARAGGQTQLSFPPAATFYRPGLGYMAFDLDKILRNDKTPSNYILEPGDVIKVPRLKDYISVRGAIDYPGLDTIGGVVHMPYARGRKPSYYIDEYCGGLTRYGKYYTIKVLGPNGRFRKTTTFLGLIYNYPTVLPGSVIYVGSFRRGINGKRVLSYDSNADLADRGGRLKDRNGNLKTADGSFESNSSTTSSTQADASVASTEQTIQDIPRATVDWELFTAKLISQVTSVLTIILLATKAF